MSRANVPEKVRRPFYGFIDDFQSFATESFAEILSEARKYQLSLTIANQYLGQLTASGHVGEAIRDAVFGNVGSIAAFQVGAADAPVLAEQFGGGVTPEDLLNLPKYRAFVRLLIDGSPSRPFTMDTIAPGEEPQLGRLPIVQKITRRNYGLPIAVVEKQVERALSAN